MSSGDNTENIKSAVAAAEETIGETDHVDTSSEKSDHTETPALTTNTSTASTGDSNGTEDEKEKSDDDDDEGVGEGGGNENVKMEDGDSTEDSELSKEQASATEGSEPEQRASSNSGDIENKGGQTVVETNHQEQKTPAMQADIEQSSTVKKETKDENSSSSSSSDSTGTHVTGEGSGSGGEASTSSYNESMSALRSQLGPLSRENLGIVARDLLHAIDKDAYDVDSWANLLHEFAQVDFQSGEAKPPPPSQPPYNIEQIRAHFDRFFTLFPTAGYFWKLYTEVEMRWGTQDSVQKVFNRCLNHNVPHLPLWTHYLRYIRGIHGLPEGPLDQIPIDDHKLNSVISAYEFALDHVGLDIGAGELWMDYIELLDRKKTQMSFQEYVAIMRKTFHNAISIPTFNVEPIWRRYESFEHNVVKSNAKLAINEQVPRYRGAMNKMVEKRTIREQGILPNMVSRPPTKSEKVELQLRIWKQLINLEKVNTQRLSPEEHLRRVSFVYQQALQHFMHYQELWFEYAQYCVEQNDFARAEQVFQRAIDTCLPDGKNPSLLLHFAFANFYEGVVKDIEKGKGVFESLLSKQKSPIIFIHYGRFLRKNVSTKAARDLFIRAIKQPSCTYHVYMAAALDEYHDTHSNDPSKGKNITVAKGIFRMGLEKYITEPNFVLSFLRFLDYINDKNDMRVLFENVLNATANRAANMKSAEQQRTNRQGLREIWNMYLEFERREGDWAEVERLEKRRDEEMQQFAQMALATAAAASKSGTGEEMDDESSLLSATNALSAGFSYSRRNTAYRFAERMKFLDLWPASPAEMEFLELGIKQDWIIEQESAAAARTGGMQQSHQRREGGRRDRDRDGVIPGTAPSQETIDMFQKVKKKLFKPNLNKMAEIDVQSLPPVLTTMMHPVRAMPSQSLATTSSASTSASSTPPFAATGSAAAGKAGLLPEPTVPGTLIIDAVLKLMPLVTNLRYDGLLPDVEFVLDSFRIHDLPPALGIRKRPLEETEPDDGDHTPPADDMDSVNALPGRSGSFVPTSRPDIYRQRRQAKLQKFS